MTTARIDPRFASFLDAQRPDRRARRNLEASAAVATVALAIAGGLGLAAEKLGVQAVAAPMAHYAITIDLGTPPPPPAKPPERPASAAGEASEAAAADPTPSRARESKPTDDDLVTTEDKASPRGPVGPLGPLATRGSDPFGVPGREGPVCAVPPCVAGPTIGTPFGDPTRTPMRKPSQPVVQPVDVVKARGVYTKDPSPKDLARTKAAVLRSTTKGVSSVAFCVEAGGTTSDVRTVKRFPGDPEVDAICRAAVAKWRFRAFLVDGRPRKTCTTTTFQIEFE